MRLLLADSVPADSVALLFKQAHAGLLCRMRKEVRR
jgi:hypothetical protein